MPLPALRIGLAGCLGILLCFPVDLYAGDPAPESPAPATAEEPQPSEAAPESPPPPEQAPEAEVKPEQMPQSGLWVKPGGSDIAPGETERTAQSGTLVRRPPEEKKVWLTVNPEAYVGGLFSNYRSLGYFSYVAFGGGVGFTLLEDWHFKLAVWAQREPHTAKTVFGTHTDHTIWFVHPALYTMYRIVHFPKWHYFVPTDFWLGVKLGANIFRVDTPIENLDDENTFLYGIAFHPKFHIIEGFGVAGHLEVGTIDYLNNYFLIYGIALFYDFEAVGKDQAEVK